MPNKAVIISWNQYSSSAKALQSALNNLGVPTLKYSKKAYSNQSPAMKYKTMMKDLVISWGCQLSVGPSVKALNTNASHISDKLKFFEWAYNVHPGFVPKWTTKPEVVEKSLNQGIPWLARLSTKASGGKGIIILEAGHAIPEAPLYVKYIKKISEYRVHFVKYNGEIRYYYQMKKKLLSHPTDPYTFKIRNLANGWVYSSINFECPSYVKKTAERFARELPLDFGALDIIYNSKEECAYVLEVNTAPGLTEKTAEWYAACFKEMF